MTPVPMVPPAQHLTVRQGDSLVLLHGTSSWRLKGIAKTGLSSHRVCLTDSEVVATEFGRLSTLEDHENYEIIQRHPKTFGKDAPEEPFPVILRVTVTDLGRLETDQAMVQEPILLMLIEKYDIDNEWDYHQAVKRGEIKLPKDEKDWRGSLRAVSSVQYNGVILPEDIEVLHGRRWIPLLKF